MKNPAHGENQGLPGLTREFLRRHRWRHDWIGEGRKSGKLTTRKISNVTALPGIKKAWRSVLSQKNWVV